MTQIRERRVIEWHDARVRDHHEVRFVAFPFRLWQTEFEVCERFNPEANRWELDVQTSKQGKITSTGKKQIRPLEVWFKSEADFIAFPELTFTQIDPQWIEREKIILARGRQPL